MTNIFLTLEDVQRDLDRLAKDKSLKRRIIRLYNNIKRIISDIPYWIKHIKWYYQRMQYGVSDKDVWSLDYYLAKVIVRGVTELRLTDYGYPSEMADSRVISEGTVGDKKAMDGWNIILCKIILGFNHIIRLHDGLEIELSRNEKEEFNEAMDLFKKYYFNLWS